MHRVKWGAGQPRSRTSVANWQLPLKWEREAEAFYRVHGRRQRVFTNSLADVFDNEVEPQWRGDLFSLIKRTPGLDWLVLTKRIGNVQKMIYQTMVDSGCDPDFDQFLPENVWLGISVCDQQEADRDIPKLLAVDASVHFLSLEPLLGPINLPFACFTGAGSLSAMEGLDWVIVGGESGPYARDMLQPWVDVIKQDCAIAGAPFFFKQGSQANWSDFKNFESFPSHLQVREWPNDSRGEVT